jgi:CheY-like chemotaxis protein
MRSRDNGQEAAMILKRVGPVSQRAPTKPLANILYVEDEDANWQVTELHLRGKYNLKRAVNSSEALAALEREHFDLLLLDIQLKGSELDGIQLCRAIRAGLRSDAARREAIMQMPIVFVTAYSARYDKPALIEAGGDDVVTKPVDYTRLLLVSSRLLVRAVQAG